MSERLLHMFNSRHDMQLAPKLSKLDFDRVLEEKQRLVISSHAEKLGVSEQPRPRTTLAPRGTVFRALGGAKK